MSERIDLEMAEAALGSGSSKGNDGLDPALGKVLPKLAKRVSQSSPQGQDTSGSNGRARDASLDSSSIDVALEGLEDRMPARARPQPRASVTNSTPNASGAITVLVRPSAALNPEVEKLRTQDINPDENSAAFMALAAANKSAGAESDGEGGQPVKKRMSVTRQLSGRYQRTTNRKVEGREIQQDHSQYALTYGLMLGIRVMTGRRDLELDKRQSMSRRNKSSENLQSAAKTEAAAAGAAAESNGSASKDTSSHTASSAPSSAPATGGFRNSLNFNPFSSHGGASDSPSGEPNHNSSSLGFGLGGHSQRDWGSDGAKQMLEERELTIADFDESLELKFRPQGSAGPPMPTPPHKLNFSFKFKDYMPAVFRAVRGLSNIDEADYMLSLAGDFNYIEFIANSKSGQFFFYSHDGCYMIKTQTKEECVLLRDIMPKYVQHLSANPNSLLVRFYGMHRVKFRTRKIYFVIMSSVFNTEKPIDIKFDLKGSLAGRRTSEESCRQGAVQKDLNLMESGRKIRLGENVELFYETLKADVELLASLNIMDYSLLVGIHDKKKAAAAGAAGTPGQQRRASGVVLAQQQQQRASVLMQQQGGGGAETGAGVPDYQEVGTIFQSYYGGIASARGVDEIYFMGIIDILQLYNLNKQTETFYKGLFADKMLQSSVRPDLYASRMLEFIMRHTDYDEVVKGKKDTAGAAGGGGAQAGSGKTGTAPAADRKNML